MSAKREKFKKIIWVLKICGGSKKIGLLFIKMLDILKARMKFYLFVAWEARTWRTWGTWHWLMVRGDRSRRSW